jgi:hypothetical protein
MWSDPAIIELFRAWASELGDHHLLPWINTVVYCLTFIAALYRRKLLGDMNAPGIERYFWLFLAFALFVLGVNKQLDFQTLLIEVGRYVARKGGWMEQRRLAQAWFTYALCGAAGFGVILLVVSMRRAWRRNASALIGLAILCVYTLFRAGSISHVFPRWQFIGMPEIRFTDLVELAGILCIFFNALARPRED